MFVQLFDSVLYALLVVF